MKNVIQSHPLNDFHQLRTINIVELDYEDRQLKCQTQQFVNVKNEYSISPVCYRGIVYS